MRRALFWKPKTNRMRVNRHCRHYRSTLKLDLEPSNDAILNNFDQLKSQNESLYLTRLNIANTKRQAMHFDDISKKQINPNNPRILNELLMTNDSYEILNIMNQYKMNQSNGKKSIDCSRMYYTCIQKLMKLNDFDNAWMLMNEYERNYDMNGFVYATKMKLIMSQERSPFSLKKILQLLNEYLNDASITDNTKALVYRTVLNSAIKVYVNQAKPCYDNMRQIVRKLRRDSEELLTNTELCRSLIRFDCKTFSCHKSMHMLTALKDKYNMDEATILDESTIASMIHSFGERILREKMQRTKEENLILCESLFNRHANILGFSSQIIFNNMVTVYGIYGDMNSVRDMIHFLEESNNLMITGPAYNALLVALIYGETNLNFNDMWNEVEEILFDKMRKITKDHNKTFSSLTLVAVMKLLKKYSHDYEKESFMKAKEIYMELTRKYDVHPYSPVFGSLVGIGWNYFKHLIHNNNGNHDILVEMDNYFNWIFQEITEVNQPIPKSWIEVWEQELNILKNLYQETLILGR